MIKDIDGLIKKVTTEIKAQTDIAVLGLSGGADSTLTAILCKLALGKENVYGLHLPYNQLDKDTFNTASQKLAKHIGIKDYTVDIGPAVDEIDKTIEKVTEYGMSDLAQGNARSRMRMIVLYNFSNFLSLWGPKSELNNSGKLNPRVRVIGTGTLSEDFIGYDTKGGDSLADFFPIGSLLKSEVYQLLDYFKDQNIITEEMINRIPSAGLWDNQTDEDELGYTYNEMEPWVLKGKADVWKDHSSDPVGKFVMERHGKNSHKHEAPPVINLREFCEEQK